MSFTSQELKSGRQAFRQLAKAGCPVKPTRGQDALGYAQYGGLFAISAEEEASDLWLNYYPASYANWENGTYSDKLAKKLEDKGLYLEWVNPAVAVVYPA